MMKKRMLKGYGVGSENSRGPIIQHRGHNIKKKKHKH